jgi:rhodanese-related sulfurtransferase
MDAGEDLYILDLRTGPGEPAQTIPGAVRVSSQDLATNWQEIPRDREIILFCS